MDQAIATAADYADAMLTARRAKNAFVLLLLLMLLAQLTFFFLIRFDVVQLNTITEAATQPARQVMAIRYFSSGCMFLGVVFSILLSLVLLLILNIMLVGRLIGVARVTSAYLFSLFLMLLLFPWQAFLNNVGLTMEQATFKFPGVLITWEELQGAKFMADASQASIMHWARFVGFPLLAVLILLIIQVKSNRGIRLSLGEDEIATSDQAAI